MRPRLHALTTLRFFAALHVVLFHMRVIGILPGGPWWYQNFASIGFVGVNFFFVLSGFILVYTYDGPSLNVRRFWWARFARIYPAYILSLIVAAPSATEGQMKRPLSKRLVNKHAPCPSCQIIFIRSPRRPLKTDRRGNAGTGCQGDRCCAPQRCRGQRRVHTSTGPKDFDSATASCSGPPAVTDGGATVIFIRSWSTRFRLSKTLPQLR